MKRVTVVPGAILAIVLAFGLFGSSAATAQQDAITRAELQKADLAGTQGYEGILSRVEIAPGGTVAKHFHPGDTFVYVLEGSLVIDVEGQPPKTVRPGDSLHELPRQVHSAKNGSSSEPVKLVVFYVKPKGEPLAVAAGEAASETSTSGAQPATSPR